MRDPTDGVSHDLTRLIGRPQLVHLLLAPPRPGVEWPTQPRQLRTEAEARLVLARCWEDHKNTPGIGVLRPVDLPAGLQHLPATIAGTAPAELDDDVLPLVWLLAEDVCSGIAKVLLDGTTPPVLERRWVRLAARFHQALTLDAHPDAAGVVRLARALAASRGGRQVVTRAILREAVAVALTEEALAVGGRSGLGLPAGRLELPPEVRDPGVRAGLHGVLMFPEALLPWPASNRWTDLAVAGRALGPLTRGERLRGLSLVDLVGLLVTWLREDGQKDLLRGLPLPVDTYPGIQTAVHGAPAWPPVMETALRGIGWWEPLKARLPTMTNPTTWLEALFKEQPGGSGEAPAALPPPAVSRGGRQLHLFDDHVPQVPDKAGAAVRQRYRALVAAMQRHVTGHTQAIENLCLGAVLHLSGAVHSRPLLAGEAGVGKTTMLHALAVALDEVWRPEAGRHQVLSLDVSALSQRGWKGLDLSDLLQPAVTKYGSFAAARHTIILADEIDKIGLLRPVGPHQGPDTRMVALENTAREAALGLQNELSALLGRGLSIATPAGEFRPEDSLIVCAGVCPKLGDHPTPADLEAAVGFSPELAGRITTVMKLQPLDTAAFAALTRRHLDELVAAAARLGVRIVVEETTLRFLAQLRPRLCGGRGALGLISTVAQARLREALAREDPAPGMMLTVAITPDDCAVASRRASASAPDRGGDA